MDRVLPKIAQRALSPAGIYVRRRPCRIERGFGAVTLDIARFDAGADGICASEGTLPLHGSANLLRRTPLPIR
jgi:hypothetical protein